ncbi:hypothetical protein K7432_008935 [Basidiobolus ranarum]|uniref:Uncharacterized protein n=1 Tax=Basidiobolus ranarum TaxID=34480 RepID=A0ABR2WRA9_9FUNG
MNQKLNLDQRLFSHINTIVKDHFSRKARNSKLDIFTLDVLAVVCGLSKRTSLLVDIFFLEIEEVKGFLEALNQCETDLRLLTSKLRGLQFSDSYTFICHLELLKEQVEVGLGSYTIINADEKLKKPQLLEVNEHTSVTSSLRNYIDELLVPFLSSSRLVLYASSLPPMLITFTGWLLNYPIAYYQPGDTQTNKNCLSNEPLTLFRVMVNPSFDILSKSRGTYEHILLSFSVPSDLNLKETIQIEFSQKLKERFEKQSFWESFQVVISQVLLPSISL